MNREEALAIIANIAAASDEQLTEALAVLGAEAEAIAADPTAENLDQLQVIVEAAETIAATQAERDADRTERSTRANELLSRLGLGQTNATGPEDDDDAEGDDAPEAPEAIEEVVVPDDASSLAPEVPVPVGAANQGTTTASAARGGATVRPRAAQALAAAQRRAARPATSAPQSDELPLVASGALTGFNEGARITSADWGRFADGVIAATQANATPPGRTWSAEKEEAAEWAQYGGGRKVSLARIPVRFGDDTPALQADAQRNEPVLDTMRRMSVDRVREALTPSMVAAGGCPCAPYPTDYTIFNLVESYNPMDADIPGMAMPRGGIRYMECLDWSGYAAGTVVRTCADENVAIGSYVAKPCVRITCPTEQSTTPIIIPACLTVGNFIANTYPELVRQALEWLGVAFEDIKQVAYEDAIRANAIAGTNYTQPTRYGAARDYLDGVQRATASYRARRHMRPDSPLVVMVPYWLPHLLVTDIRNQGFGGLKEYGDIQDPDTWLREALRKFNVVPNYWYLRPTNVASTQWIDRAQTDAAALNQWPTSVETIITAPGVWNRGQIADIDFGLVVDSPLIKTNDAMYFQETMVSIFNRCSTATELLTSTLCPSGAAAATVTPFTCP